MGTLFWWCYFMGHESPVTPFSKFSQSLLFFKRILDFVRQNFFGQKNTLCRRLRAKQTSLFVLPGEKAKITNSARKHCAFVSCRFVHNTQHDLYKDNVWRGEWSQS